MMTNKLSLKSRGWFYVIVIGSTNLVQNVRDSFRSTWEIEVEVARRPPCRSYSLQKSLKHTKMSYILDFTCKTWMYVAIVALLIHKAPHLS